jgi:hypothetical protein
LPAFQDSAQRIPSLRRIPRRLQNNQEKSIIMNINHISKSRKTFIRKEKARIRREINDVSEQNKLISALYPALPNA